VTLVAPQQPHTDLLLELAHNQEIFGGAGVLVLVAANFESTAVALAIELGALGLAVAPPARWRVGVLDATSLRTGAQPLASTVVQLPARSVVAVQMPLARGRRQAAQSTARPPATSRRSEYFAAAVMEPVPCHGGCGDALSCSRCRPAAASLIRFATNITLPCSFTSKASAAPPSRAWLRLGMRGDAVRCPSWNISVNAISGARTCSGSQNSSPRSPAVFAIGYTPPPDFRAGGCAATTQNCTAAGVDDGLQSSFGELELRGWAVPPVTGDDVIEIVLEGCEMDRLRRTRTPTNQLRAEWPRGPDLPR
jgi:hypothetical protein